MLDLIWFLLIGAAAGWIARRIMNRPELNLAANIVLGIVGAFVGGFALRLIGLHAAGTLGTLVAATLGAVGLIWVAGRTRAFD